MASDSIRVKRAAGGPLGAIVDWIGDLGGLVLNWIVAVGDVAQFFFRSDDRHLAPRALRMRENRLGAQELR